MPEVDARRPNVVVILADDLGYSDIGCFGGEIRTPHLDRLGRSSVRMTSFYNTARCSPSRASLLTGRHPHETGIGILTENLAPVGAYPGTLGRDFATLAEHLHAQGYATCLSGKWHLSSQTREPDASWPTRRGFDEFFGIMPGADSYFHPRHLWHGERHLDVPDGDFYLTDAVSEHAAGWVAQHADAPFFLYLAYTAPHWPLQAPEADVTGYLDTYRRGWDDLRAERHARLVGEGLLGAESPLSERDPTQPAWQDVDDPEWEARRMAVYAAQVERMDAGIGRVLHALTDAGVADDTIVVFLSDNGACAETLPPPHAPHFLARNSADTPDGRPVRIGNDPSIVPGAGDTYASYGQAWANLSNTPFRLYKRWVHEGGIATPLIASWPAGGLEPGTVLHDAYQLTDVAPTLLEAVGAPRDGLPGVSMLDTWRGGPGVPHALYWEHVGNAAARDGRWKVVREADAPWELYDVSSDRSETVDRAQESPEVVDELAQAWQRWADSVGVLPWARMRDIVRTHGG